MRTRRNHQLYHFQTLNDLANLSRKWSPQQWAGYLMAIKENLYKIHLIEIINNIHIFKRSNTCLYALLNNVVLNNILEFLLPLVHPITERQQEVMERYFIRGMSEREISDDLGLSISAIKSRKSAAIKKMYDSTHGAYPISKMINYPLIKIHPGRFSSPEERLLRAILCNLNEV